MCYSDHARPPIPPGDKTPARGEELVLTSSDGNRFAAYAGHPSVPVGASVIIYPDVRGLHSFYKDLAIRFAEVGILALAMDYFGRTAGLTPRDDSFEYMPHVQQVRLDTLMLDAASALAWLRSESGAPVFLLGFCMGGRNTLLTGTNREFGFAGLIPFYAGLGPSPLSGGESVLDKAHQIVYPVLGLFGGADPNIPESMVKDLDTRLDTTGVEHELIIYPGAPHSFFDRKAAEYADASASAWERVLEFIAAHKN